MDVLVYGASGTLGGLVLRHLRGRGLRLWLGGRNSEELARLAQPDEGVWGEDWSGLKVVVNCTPLTQEVIQRCLEHSVHYVDACGDQAQIHHLLDRFDAGARRAGICIVPAVGVDYSLGDCLSSLACPCEELTIAYSFSEGAAGNSMDFATAAPRGAEVVFRQGAWRPVPFEKDGAHFTFPQPFGRQQVARYGCGEVVMVPRHSQVITIRSWINAASLAPHPWLLPVFPWLRPLVSRLLRTGFRQLLGWLRQRLSGPRQQVRSAPAQGPSFAVVVEAQGFGPGRRLWARGEDCHQATAAILALAAEWLARGRATPGGGALTTAQAFASQEFLQALQPEVHWQWQR